MDVTVLKNSFMENNRDLWFERLYLNHVIRFLLDSPPDKKRVDELAQNPVFLTFSEVSEGAARIQSILNTLSDDPTKWISRARDEYNILFVGPNALPAPPWESVYLGKENLLFEETTLKVRECYKAHGLSFIRENNEPDDHIVIELEFLAYLIEESLQATDIDSLRSNWVHQVSFLQNHFLRWAPQYASLLFENAQTEWFRGASQILNEYILLEKEVCSTIKEALNNE